MGEADATVRFGREQQLPRRGKCRQRPRQQPGMFTARRNNPAEIQRGGCLANTTLVELLAHTECQPDPSSDALACKSWTEL